MTKRKWERIEQLESPMADDGLNIPFSPTQQTGASPHGSIPVGHLAYVGEPEHSDEVALDDTSATKEGRFSPFWALLARAGYMVWNQNG